MRTGFIQRESAGILRLLLWCVFLGLCNNSTFVVAYEFDGVVVGVGYINRAPPDPRVDLQIGLQPPLNEVCQDPFVILQRNFDREVMQRRTFWIGATPRLAFSIRVPRIAEQPNNLGMPFDAVGDSHEGDGVLNHPNKRKSKHVPIKRDGTLKVGDSHDHFANPQRPDRTRGILGRCASSPSISETSCADGLRSSLIGGPILDFRNRPSCFVRRPQ